MTIKQQNFVKDYLETGNATLAIKMNYDVANDATARSTSSENLAKPNIRSTILEALDKRGISNEFIAEKILDLLNAK